MLLLFQAQADLLAHCREKRKGYNSRSESTVTVRKVAVMTLGWLQHKWAKSLWGYPSYTNAIISKSFNSQVTADFLSNNSLEDTRIGLICNQPHEAIGLMNTMWARAVIWKLKISLLFSCFSATLTNDFTAGMWWMVFIQSRNQKSSIKSTVLNFSIQQTYGLCTYAPLQSPSWAKALISEVPEILCWGSYSF